jgi:ATP/maltotriose-dependent transcriptional regulator MalT
LDSHTERADLRAEPPVPLSERELDVLRLMASGSSNREIADELVIAEATAKNHVSNILSKLHVHDRSGAVSRAVELGILTHPES